MSERKTVSATELVAEAERIAPKIVELVQRETTSVLGGLLGLYIAGRMIERIGVLTFGEEFRKQVEQIKAMDLAAGTMAEALTSKGGMPSAGGEG